MEKSNNKGFHPYKEVKETSLRPQVEKRRSSVDFGLGNTPRVKAEIIDPMLAKALDACNHGNYFEKAIEDMYAKFGSLDKANMAASLIGKAFGRGDLLDTDKIAPSQFVDTQSTLTS